MAGRPYRLLSSRRIFKGRIIELLQDRFVHRSSPGKIIRRELVRHPGAVVIVPFVAPGKLLLQRQFRWAAKSNLWEIPAGTMEKGERPLACAKRELEEETGFKAARWTLLTRFYPAPGISDEVMWLYRAEKFSKGTLNLDADEWIRTHAVTTAQALRMIRRGLIRDGKTIAGILWSVTYR